MNDFRAPVHVHHDAGTDPGRTPVWDLPVRIFHWLMVASFAGAYLSAESDSWRTLHVTLGYTMAILVVFRLFWGFFGTAHARFARFVRGPRATMAYLRSLLRGAPPAFTGHNPAGALAIVALLALAAALAVSGWLLTGPAGESLEDVHEFIAHLMLALVLIHVAGVLLDSWLHRENLAWAMVTGRKRAAAGEPAQPMRITVGLLLLAAVLGFWWWQAAHPDAPLGLGTLATREHHGGKGHDD